MRAAFPIDRSRIGRCKPHLSGNGAHGVTRPTFCTRGAQGLTRPTLGKSAATLMACWIVGTGVLAWGDGKEEEQANRGSVAVEPQSVKVTTEREGDIIHFFVENRELCEVTMTFDMELQNLTSSARFPYTASFSAGKTEAFSLSPCEPNDKWGYNYTNYYKLGSCSARHEDDFLYELPYDAGTAFRVTQAYGGSFSHKGSNKYAIDWKMPVGTLVRAARGGLVVKTKDDSKRGGSSMKYDRYNNYVLIRHEDGTLGHYCHLVKAGCLVRAGQVVKAGDPIAHSGNTGFSSGPHLHFCVFKTRDGRERESIPIRFQTAETAGITLEEGRNYKAAGLAPVSAQITVPQQAAQGGVSQ